jgi:hypothetical protein
MALENHNRLDKILHAEEYLGMLCGTPSHVYSTVHPGSSAGAGGGILVPGEDGKPKLEKRYCGPDCPTLKAEILAEAHK